MLKIRVLVFFVIIQSVFAMEDEELKKAFRKGFEIGKQAKQNQQVQQTQLSTQEGN